MSVLETLGPKYLWWEPVGDGAFTDERLIAQIMNIGDFHDMQAVASEVGDDRLRTVISRAQPGWFSPRSWAFWHYRLGLTDIGADVPPLKKRSFGR